MPSAQVKYRVNAASVVLLAQVHNPAIINPDFLKKNGIAGEGWEVDDNAPLISTPGMSLVYFRNGVHWQVLPDRCVIRETLEKEFRLSYLVQECAKKYVDALRHIPYTALGINWELSLEMEKEDRGWFKTRFLKPGGWLKTIELTSITFRVTPRCNLTVNTQDKTVNCNFHTDISPDSDDKVKDIHSALDKFMDHQKILKTALDKYLK